MLLGGDLGLLFSAAAAGVVVVWLFVIRWKWRRSVSRRLEIKRLMALAFEEAARAELEAASGYKSSHVYAPAERGYVYAPVASEPVAEEVVVGPGSSPGRLLQYQCEVCFCPTTTRCKQCKAVHYCSGKCQIIHWRQGHKDECHSLSVHQNNIDAEARSRLKEFNRTEIGNTGNVNGVEIRHTMEPVELFSKEQMSSYPDFHVLSEKTGTEDEYNDWKGTDMNVEASDNSLLSETSSNVLTYMSVATGNKLIHSNSYGNESTFTSMESLLSPEQPVLTNPDNGIPIPNDQHSYGFLDADELAEDSFSSSFSTVGSEEHFVSLPSTPSSDFWEGTVESIRTKIEPLGVSSDANILNSRSYSVSNLDGMKFHAKVLGSDTNKVTKDDPLRVTSVSKNLSEKAKGPVLLTREPSNHVTVSNTSVESISKNGEVKSSTHTGSQEKKLSLAPKKSDNKIDHINDVSNHVDRPKNNSQAVAATEAQLSSVRIRKHAVLAPHSVENERAHRVGVAPPKDSGNVKNVRSGTNPSQRVMDKTKASNVIARGSSEGGNGVNEIYKGSYEVFVKLYNWNKVDLRPCGLVNCGNSCYANAVLQCLSFTPPLTGYFLEGLHSKACEKKEWCFTCELEMLVRKAKGSYSPVSPARIISKMQRIGRHLGDGREEDAHEFLRYAIEAMQYVCLKEAGVNKPSSLDEETTLMGLTFGGYLRSKIECMKCGGVSEQHERMMDLTVEIGGDIGTLEEALCQFTHSEILDGENKYLCGRCKSYEKAKKRLRVSEAPNVLTIALKRFQSGRYGKLNKAVKFPEVLNLAPYMSGTTDRAPIYMLYGVVVHLDIMNAAFSGHYVCYIKNKQGRWFQADDSSVQTVEIEKVLSKGAYMLFYARLSPRAPKAIRSPMPPPEPRKSANTSSKPNSHPTESFHPPLAKLNSQNSNHCLYHHHPYFEDNEHSSEISSSIFSESGSSHTTESSSNRESTSTDENLDQILNDMRNYWTSPSDSDTSSESSTPSPMHARPSPLADVDSYSSGSDGDRDGFRSVLCPDSDREKEKLVGNGISCRENESSRLGGNNNMKGLYLRRSVTGRTA